HDVDGGMLVEHTLVKGRSNIEPGTVFAIDSMDATSYTISGTNKGSDEAWTAKLASSERGPISDVLRFYDVTLANPKLLGGIFIGVLLAFLFCALTMNA